MKGFDTLHVKSATKSHNKFDLSRTHLTTADFGEIIPLFAEECVPGDKFNIKGNYFSRLAPLAKPTYGKFQFKTMNVFVPYYQVADDAEAYLAGQTYWEGETSAIRYIRMYDIVNFLFSNDDIATAVTDASAAYDIKVVNGVGVAAHLKLTPKGRYFVKVLNALGYALPQNADIRPTSTWYQSIGVLNLNALPILCFFKAYNDYMSQSQRYNTSQLTAFLKAVKHNKTVTGYSTSQKRIEAAGLKTMFDNLLACYENDYFVSAWQSPNSPLSTPDSIMSFSAPYSDGAGSTLEMENTANSVHMDVSSYGIAQRALDFLKSFDDWVRRNNYSGSRAVQKVYSRFGIKTEDYRSNYAHVISTDNIPIQVGDVTSQADTTGATLGDYAGKGIASGEKGFSFECKDYGMLFVFGWITVTPMNAYGFARYTLKNQPLDFYNAEFDGLGAQAIPYCELFCNPICDSADTTTDTSVFGFTERYNEYRYGRDMITGDFRNFNPDNEMNTWHMGRLLNDVRKSGNMVAQNASMNTMSPTTEEYDRIFSVTSGPENHFYLTCYFDVNAVRPMLSLNQVPRLGEGDTTVPKNGNVIN